MASVLGRNLNGRDLFRDLKTIGLLNLRIALVSIMFDIVLLNNIDCLSFMARSNIFQLACTIIKMKLSTYTGLRLRWITEDMR